MNRQDRAKQFAPFDALKGLQEALREKEELHERVAKRDLSDEKKAELSAKFSSLRRGQGITVTFFRSGHYLSVQGIVASVNLCEHYLQIGEGRIFFEDISELSND